MYSFVTGGLTSEATIAAVTTITQSFVHIPPASFSGQVIWTTDTPAGADDAPRIYYGSSVARIYIQNCPDRHEDPDIWYFTCSSTNLERVTIKWNPAASTTPVVKVGDSYPTVTHYQTNTVLHALATSAWYWGSTGCRLGLLTTWNSSLTTTQIDQLHKSRRMYEALEISPSTLLHFIPCDDFGANTYTANSSTILPNIDIANTFSSGTYASLRTDDTSYLIANKSDDNETYTCGFDTFTFPTGESAYYFLTTLMGLTDDTAIATFFITLNSINQASSTTAGYTSSFSNALAVNYVAATQSDVDGVTASIVTPAMGKDDELDFDLMNIKVGTRKRPTRDIAKRTTWRTLPSSVLSLGFSGTGYSL